MAEWRSAHQVLSAGTSDMNGPASFIGPALFFLLLILIVAIAVAE